MRSGRQRQRTRRKWARVPLHQRKARGKSGLVPNGRALRRRRRQPGGSRALTRSRTG